MTSTISSITKAPETTSLGAVSATAQSVPTAPINTNSTIASAEEGTEGYCAPIYNALSKIWEFICKFFSSSESETSSTHPIPLLPNDAPYLQRNLTQNLHEFHNLSLFDSHFMRIKARFTLQVNALAQRIAEGENVENIEDAVKQLAAPLKTYIDSLPAWNCPLKSKALFKCYITSIFVYIDSISQQIPTVEEEGSILTISEKAPEPPVLSEGGLIDRKINQLIRQWDSYLFSNAELAEHSRAFSLFLHQTHISLQKGEYDRYDNGKGKKYIKKSEGYRNIKRILKTFPEEQLSTKQCKLHLKEIKTWFQEKERLAYHNIL